MAQVETHGVQHHARRVAGLASISAVAEDRKTRVREVDAHLVLAPGAGVRLHEEAAREHGGDHEIRDRGPVFHRGVRAPGLRGQTRGPLRQRQVGLLDRVGGELRGQAGIRGRLLHEEHDARRVLVETLMHAERARRHRPAAPGARSKERLDETDEGGPARVGGRDGDQPRRLVHRDQRVVFVEDARLAQGRGTGVAAHELGPHEELEGRPALDEMPGGPQGPAANAQATGHDQAAHRGP